MDYKGLTVPEKEEVKMKDTHPDDEVHDMFGVDRPTEQKLKGDPDEVIDDFVGLPEV